MIHTGDDALYEDRFVCILSSLTERVFHSEGGSKKCACVCVCVMQYASEAPTPQMSSKDGRESEQNVEYSQCLLLGNYIT